MVNPSNRDGHWSNNYVKLTSAIGDAGQRVKRERSMRTLKEISGLLLLASVIVGVGQFLPGLNVLFDDYLVGFLVVVVVIPVIRIMYKLHMVKVSKLSPKVRKEKEKENQAWWDGNIFSITGS